MIGNLESSWTRVEDKLFEEALVQYFQEDDAGAGEGEFDGSPDWRWRRIADAVPGKSPEDCRAHYEALVHDVNQIDLGRVELPSYPDESSSWWAGSDSGRSSQISFASSGSGKGKHSDVERKKGTPWTEEEHKLFLIGLEKYGKGDWRSISRNVVVTRTPTQVASHAQKYYLRQSSGKKERKRSSIHDITTVDDKEVAAPVEQNWIPPPNSNQPHTLQPQFGGPQGGSFGYQNFGFPM